MDVKAKNNKKFYSNQVILFFRHLRTIYFLWQSMKTQMYMPHLMIKESLVILPKVN